MRRLLVLASLAACGSRAHPPAPALSGEAGMPAPAAASNLPSEPEEALRILDDMNEWCTGQTDECDVASRPEAYPGRDASGETNGWILDHRERLSKLGVEVAWDVSRHRFVTQTEWDLRLMVGGNFAPDHLGPALFDAISQRAHAHAALYLGVLVDRVVGATPDTGWLSSSYVAFVIDLLAPDAPQVAADAAARVLPLFEAALQASTPPPADDEYRQTRLTERVMDLRTAARSGSGTP